MSDLKPCPFCGKDPSKTATELRDRPCFYYECGNPKCHAAEMGWHDTEQEARDAWNNRLIEAALQARIDELERRIANAVDSATAAQNCIKIARIDVYKVLERIKYILTAPPKEES